MGLHKSLDEKTYNILSSSKNAIAKSSEILNDKDIPAPIFMNMDSVIKAFDKYPNIRPIINELNKWNECKLTFFDENSIKLKDVSSIEIKSIIEKNGHIYIITGNEIYVSCDGINFGKKNIPELNNIVISNNTPNIENKYISIKNIGNTCISPFVWGAEKVANILIPSKNAEISFNIKEFMANIIGIYYIFEKYLLIVTSIEYYWIEIDRYVEHLYFTLNIAIEDSEYTQSNVFIFRDNIKDITNIEIGEEKCVLCGLLTSGELFTMNITKSMNIVIKYYEEETKYDSITHLGFGYILKTNNLMKSGISIYDIRNNSISEIADNSNIYPSCNSQEKFNHIRAVFHNKNYNIFADDDALWCTPEFPIINSQGIFMRGISMKIVPFIREYVKIWKTENYIYILNSVGSLYCFNLPGYIADSFFSSSSSLFVPGFNNIIKNGIIGKDIEGLIWNEIKSDIANSFTSIQTAYGCGIGLILTKDATSDIYTFYKMNNQEIIKISDIASFHYDLYQSTIPPFNINDIKPSTHNLLIASTNDRFYIIIYNLSDRSCYIYICSGGFKSGIFREIEIDNNLIAYFNRAVYAFGYDGLLTIVMNTPNLSQYPTFCFDPESPMISTSSFIQYNVEWLNSYNSTPNIYENNGQIMDNRPGIASIYIPSHSNIGYSNENQIISIENTDELINDVNLYHVTKSIDRTALFYSAYYDEDGPYNEDENAKIISCQYQTDGSILRSEFELMKHIYAYKELIPRGMIYNLANSIIYLDLINRIGLITYDGITWFTMDDDNIPNGTNVYYVGYVGELNFIITDAGTFVNKQIRKNVHNNYIYDEYDIFHIDDRYLTFTHTFNFTPDIILVNIKIVTNLWTKYININIGGNEITDDGIMIYKSLSIFDDTSNLVLVNEECDDDWTICLYDNTLYLSNSGNFIDGITEIQSSHIQIIALI